MKSSIDILCTRCGTETFLKREPLYEGLRKTGEQLSCPACGNIFESESDVPFRDKEEVPVVFTEADRPAETAVFEKGENRRLCRYCAEYTVNPFMQFCSLHKKEVQATDTCPRFVSAPETPPKPLL